MEYDIILKNFLAKDNSVLMTESKLSLDFLKCKIENCYSNNHITKITHQDYEECKRACLRELEKFNNLRTYIYEDFTNFYYKKFLDCSNHEKNELYNDCLDNNKRLMAKNIEDIKKLIPKFGI